MAMRVGPQGPKLLTDVRFDIVQYTRGKGVDIGRGEYKAFPHFIGVREKGDETIATPVEADFTVDSFHNLDEFIDGELDFVFVWGFTKDESADYGFAKAATKLLKKGGFYIQVAEAHIEEEGGFKQEINACMIARKGDDTLEHFTFTSGHKVVPQPHHRAPNKDEKTAIVVRYGAIGDMLQTASVLPELKRQGYHVSVNCHPEGELVLRCDPNIDAFIVQEKDQVPNNELPAYWETLKGRCDRLINLCESVEGALLLHPGRANHRWPHAMRKKYCNLNYLEFMAEIAELPFHPEHKFHATKEERDSAIELLAQIGGQCNPGWVAGMAQWTHPFVILWALAGSSVHKFYPHQDAVMARILSEIPNAHILLVGDDAAQMLEAGWEKEPRVHRYSGVMQLRDVLALAPLCQVVIGPETGVLNSVAFESCAKVVLLSHSTKENLTRDWVNTDSLATDVTPCYPCHRLHYDHTYCPQDETTGAAMCQVELAPSSVWEAIQRAYVGWSTIRKLTAP